MSLILMFLLWANILNGLNEGTSDIIMRVVKIGLVLFFVSDQGWEMFDRFVVSIFKDGVNQITYMMATSFDDSPELRSAIASGYYGDKHVLFQSSDKVVGLLFKDVEAEKILALLFSGLFGRVYILIITILSLLTFLQYQLQYWFTLRPKSLYRCYLYLAQYSLYLIYLVKQKKCLISVYSN